MVAAAETFGSKALKRQIKRREKTVHVEDKVVTQARRLDTVGPALL
jgi:hypothetical protein